jgi:osmotically-inducible protein OsmY
VNTVKNVVVPIVALVLVGALSGCATLGESVGKCETTACSSDAKLTSDVQTNLTQHAEFGANALQVQTLHNVVYLNGSLSGGEQRANAELVALQTPGVARVVNDIAVTK